MKKPARKVKLLTLIGCTLLIALPSISIGQGTGHDWYCPDHDAHKQYQQHRKSHHDYAAKAIAAMVREIFNDPTLSMDQKNAKAEKLIIKELEKVKLGLGD